MQPREDRIYSLDSLRGLAAVYVVLFHLFLVPTPTPVIPDAAAAQAVMFGGTGVFLFFVISGFSLSMTMPRHDRAQWPTMSYGLSRLFRIAPMFVFMLAVSCFRDRWYFGTLPSLPNVVLNLSFLFNLVPGHQEGIVWASWTIGVEMLFYAIFPLLIHAGILVQIISGLAALVLFTALDGYAPGYFYWSFLGYFPLFIVGMLAFEAHAALKGSRHRPVLGLGLIAAGLLILLACMTVAGAEKDIHLRNPIGIGYAALLVGCVLRNPVVLRTRPLMLFGRISYPLYLIHAPVVYAGSALFLRITGNLPASVSYLICAGITFAVATPLAYLAHIAVERPGIEMGRRALRLVEQRRRVRPSGAA